MSCAKTKVQIAMQFGMLSRVDPGNHVLYGVHIDVTWIIRLKRLCAVAMRLMSTQVTLTTCSLLVSCPVTYLLTAGYEWRPILMLYSVYHCILHVIVS